MLVAVAPGAGGGARCQRLDPAGQPVGAPFTVSDLVALMRAEPPATRWLWPATAQLYPDLLRHGALVDRCHDLELTEALLLGYEGQWGQPRALAAAWARLTGAPVPPDPPVPGSAPPGAGQDTLFDPAPASPTGLEVLPATVAVYRDQVRRIAATARPGRFRLLVAAESAGALVAVEMGRAGLPWRAEVHDDILHRLLGTVPPVGGPPSRLVELAAAINDAFGARVRADSPAEVLRAFARAGVQVPNTRAYVLRDVRHPAAPLLLEYKELYRVWVAHGWAWRAQWVRDGRFHPEYVPGGVVSGRWATRGGGALQIPKVVRAAVMADPGWKLVVADAGQLEPRILAAVSGDAAMARAAAAGDMYAALATDAFGGDRATAKVALLGAMYGQVGGQAAPALASLRRSYPAALAHVEQAARTGETGGLVRSWLGRTCPPPSVSLSVGAEDDAGEPGASGSGGAARARARGRFTRNFVIQATAAEWALVLLASLRPGLAGLGAELVFFQHDEVIVHCPAAVADEAAELIRAAGEQARGLLFGATPVRFPLHVSVVDSYAEAK